MCVFCKIINKEIPAYTLYENANGWCKIDYNGKTGYVKSDFVDIQ